MKILTCLLVATAMLLSASCNAARPQLDDANIHAHHTPEQHAAWLRAAKRLGADTNDASGDSSGLGSGGGGHHH